VSDRIVITVSFRRADGAAVAVTPARPVAIIKGVDDHYRGPAGQHVARSQIAKVEHHKALPFADVPDFMAQLSEREGMAARALEFTILTACRPGETIGATWDEIDLAAKVWTIPAGRMKASREHRVPLSKRALRADWLL
jgi:integrase